MSRRLLREFIRECLTDALDESSSEDILDQLSAAGEMPDDRINDATRQVLSRLEKQGLVRLLAPGANRPACWISTGKGADPASVARASDDEARSESMPGPGKIPSFVIPW